MLSVLFLIVLLLALLVFWISLVYLSAMKAMVWVEIQVMLIWLCYVHDFDKLPIHSHLNLMAFY